ncbi:hypothetical protein [Nostoc sp. UHCC 0870]|uniref:hypothetical protein n=1 Tax=Nostoc sp. UHCC 0870 TaxID=2914041 RepID=UPI001EE070DE|nr:hypothetical protein [Nostoc sp. UHCC 0870]UKO96745.1 hypothetical protein L6494_19310 [Nostoc sp. UHCC 0870]
MKSLTLNSKMILGSFMTLSFLYLNPQPSMAQLNCNVVESFGNASQSQILRELNNRLAGGSHNINRRKDLRINQVENVSFNGCRITVKTNVTLERKIRRDAHGTVTIRADITSFSLPNRQLCYENAKVTDVSLSRTLGIGEAVYKWVANRVLPNKDCLGV